MERESSLILNIWRVVRLSATLHYFAMHLISRLLTINVVVRENLEKFPSTPNASNASNASNTPTPSHLLPFVVWRVGITDIFLYFCSTIQT